MNLQTANALVGGLSHTTKMPCPSYGLPTHACIRGQKLAKVSGTICVGSPRWVIQTGSTP